jgi:hypothetical protein
MSAHRPRIKRILWGISATVIVASCSVGSGSSQPTESKAKSAAEGPWEGVNGKRVTASMACQESMTKAADEPDSTLAEPLIISTLTACTSVDEWLSELERQPSAMGLTAQARLGRIDLSVVCFRAPTTPVCIDAERRGVPVGE